MPQKHYPSLRNVKLGWEILAKLIELKIFLA